MTEPATSTAGGRVTPPSGGGLPKSPGQIVQSMTGEAHPLADLFPLMEGEEFEELKADILANGLRLPVVVTPHGIILDGRNRYRACKALEHSGGERAVVPQHARLSDKNVKIANFSSDEQVSTIVSMNVHRRHMTTSQRAMTAARWNDVGNFTKIPTLASRASIFRVSVSTLQHAEAVLRSGDVDLIAAVDAGRFTVSDAAERLKAQARSLPEHKAEIAAKRAERERRAEEKQRQQEVRDRVLASGYGKHDPERAPYLGDQALLEEDAPADVAVEPFTPPSRHREEEPQPDQEPVEKPIAKPDWETIVDSLGVSQAVRSETLAFPHRSQVRIAFHALSDLTPEEAAFLLGKLARRAGVDAVATVHNRLRVEQAERAAQRR